MKPSALKRTNTFPTNVAVELFDIQGKGMQDLSKNDYCFSYYGFDLAPRLLN